MLTVLSAVTRPLDAVGVPVDHFYCEGSEITYELVLGHLPPLLAVDALFTVKGTSRRTCREDVHLIFNPTLAEINGLHTNISVQNRNRPIGKVEEHFLTSLIKQVKALCAFATRRLRANCRRAVVR